MFIYQFIFSEDSQWLPENIPFIACCLTTSPDAVRVFQVNVVLVLLKQQFNQTLNSFFQFVHVRDRRGHLTYSGLGPTGWECVGKNEAIEFRPKKRDTP